jgi:hypothetical protein
VHSPEFDLLHLQMASVTKEMSEVNVLCMDLESVWLGDDIITEDSPDDRASGWGFPTLPLLSDFNQNWYLTTNFIKVLFL